jgi:GC-rich sequence DNA-binding factor-like protein
MFKFFVLNSGSVFDLIRPWRDVLPKDQWENMLNRGVLSKLVFHAETLKIRPESQEIKVVKDLLKWIEIMTKEQIEIIFEGIYNKLEATFNSWLGKPGRSIEEMKIWINGWERMLKKVTEKINKTEIIKKMKERLEIEK